MNKIDRAINRKEKKKLNEIKGYTNLSKMREICLNAAVEITRDFCIRKLGLKVEEVEPILQNAKQQMNKNMHNGYNINTSHK